MVGGCLCVCVCEWVCVCVCMEGWEGGGWKVSLFLLTLVLFVPSCFLEGKALFYLFYFFGRQSADLNRDAWRDGESFWTLSSLLMQSPFQTLTCGVSHIHRWCVRACVCRCVCVFTWSWLFSSSLSLTLISSVKRLDGCISISPPGSIRNPGHRDSPLMEFSTLGSTQTQSGAKCLMCAFV